MDSVSFVNIVKNIVYLKLIIVENAKDALTEWIITVHGQTTVWVLKH